MTRLRHPQRQIRQTDLSMVDGFRRRDTPSSAARDLGECVYAVRTPDGLVKIGYTGNLNQRIRGFGSVWADVLLAVSADMDYEKALHKRFAPYVARGNEYYFPVIEIMDWINAERAVLLAGDA